MEPGWHLDRRRNVFTRSVTATLDEVVGRFSVPSDSVLPSLQALLPLIDLFSRYAKADAEYAPGCLRLTTGKLQKFPIDVLEWAVQEGIVVSVERQGKPCAYRLSATWQPWLLERCSVYQKSKAVDWSRIDAVYGRYSQLGLRIAAQIAYGNTHYLDGLQIPSEYQEKVWAFPDAIVRGANVVRVGGRFMMDTLWTSCRERWSLPGHYLWSWEIEATEPYQVQSASQVLLIENPYAFWQMMKTFAGQDYALICLHGESRQPGFLSEDAALYQLFQKLLGQPHPPSFSIWCDPDPGGLVMATNANQIIRALGGQSSFFMMQPDCLDRLESIVMAERRLLPITVEDEQILSTNAIHPNLHPLADVIRQRARKGEQEALTLDVRNLKY